MQQKEVRPGGKNEARRCAAAVLERTWACKVRRIRYIGGGSFGFVFRAVTDRDPGTVIMKACRTKGLCSREADELRRLGADSLIKIPQVYFTFFADDRIPFDFICMESVAGTNCFTDFRKLLQPKNRKARFADEVTAAIRHWHMQTNETFGLIGNAVYAQWLDYYRPFAAEVLACARQMAENGTLEKKVLAAMERGWAAFGFIFSEKVEQASLIHGDLNVMNIMSDRHLRPTAIIDPLESKWADREYELFQLRNLTGDRFGLYDTYKAKYPVSEKCDLKTAFYALYHEVYAFIISGKKIRTVLMPLVKRMHTELNRWGL